MSVGATKRMPSPVSADRQQQRQVQVVGWRGDVAHAVDQQAPRPQPGQSGDHREAGVGAEGLHADDRRPHRLLEVAQVAQQHQQQRGMEHPAEEPGPLAGLEQALEEDHLARQAQRHAGGRGRRRRGRDLQRRRRARRSGGS